MADPRLTVVKMLMKMESSEAYSNLLLDHAFNEAELSDRDKAFAAALFYGVLERRLTLDHVIRTNSKIAFEKLDKAAVQILRTGLSAALHAVCSRKRGGQRKRKDVQEAEMLLRPGVR